MRIGGHPPFISAVGSDAADAASLPRSPSRRKRCECKALRHVLARPDPCKPPIRQASRRRGGDAAGLRVTYVSGVRSLRASGLPICGGVSVASRRSSTCREPAGGPFAALVDQRLLPPAVNPATRRSCLSATPQHPAHRGDAARPASSKVGGVGCRAAPEAGFIMARLEGWGVAHGLWSGGGASALAVRAV